MWFGFGGGGFCCCCLMVVFWVFGFGVWGVLFLRGGKKVFCFLLVVFAFCVCVFALVWFGGFLFGLCVGCVFLFPLPPPIIYCF